MQALRTLIPATIPRVDEIGLDLTVLGFGLFITIACGLFFGMAPASRGARANLLSALTQSGRGVLGSSRERWRHGLVVAQTGLATMLVVLAALLLQSLVRLQQVPLGFEPGGVMTARVSVPRAKYPDAAAILAFHRTLLGSLETLPSVQAVGLMTSAPFAPGVRRGVTLRDRAAAGASSDAPTSAVEQVVSPGVFRALGARLLAGREFGAQDQPGSPLVAIVSEGLARRLWADADAIGRVLEFDGRRHDVVGVVEDIRGTRARRTRRKSRSRSGVRWCTCLVGAIPAEHRLRSSFAQTPSSRRSCRRFVRRSARSIPPSRCRTCAAWRRGSPKARRSRV